MKLGPGKQCGRQTASQRANLITEQFWPITNEVTHNHQKDLFFLPHLSPCACNSSLPPANFFNSLLNMKGLKIVVGRYKCCFCGFLHTHTHTYVLKKRVTSPCNLFPGGAARVLLVHMIVPVLPPTLMAQEMAGSAQPGAVHSNLE